MSVSSIGSASQAYASTIQPQTRTQEARPDRENDGDSDDGKVATAQASGPTVNLQGQTVGSLINVTA